MEHDYETVRIQWVQTYREIARLEAYLVERRLDLALAQAALEVLKNRAAP